MENCNVSCLSSDIGNLISLTHLDLNGNNLCTLPDSIGNLTRLQILNMAYCNVSYLSSEIGNLISLTDLDLRGNDLCALPDSIGNLTRLQSLKMVGCNVSHLPSEIGSLISLRDLNLVENNLRSLPDSIGNLTCLTFLAISNCNVSYLPSEIGSLISLTGLFLDGNNFCTLPDSIGNLTRLVCLHMTNCNVSYLPSEIGSLISLANLVLDGNNLCTLPDSVGKLYRLIGLSMNNCNLSHMPSAIWRLMGLSLEYLYLKGCHKSAESNFVYNVMKAAIWQVQDYRMFHPIHGFVNHSSIHLTWGEVPRWFEYQTEGSSLSVKVPPLVNQKIWSLAVCVIYIGSNSNEKCNQKGFFFLEYHINKVQRRSYLIGDRGDGLCREDQMFLKFTSMSELEGGDEVEIFITKCWHIQVKKCAAKLIFEVDEDTDDEA
ncbi:leucine-rich repeat protein SHOC-2-like [Camellia sinensis]|uniref:leucine-rich repeat protein SHOC-2-like n=1 Tax=Camellia sinensis TaxID=4442 RepID=UPI001035A1AB|nr:leucine-rich repeat protein SHOC-2-like [Camellia sinensis]